MSENTVQDNVQELATNSQSDSVSSNQDSGLLQEVMQKKERLQKAESELAELKGKMEEERKAQLSKNEEWKTLYEESRSELDRVKPELESFKMQETANKDKMLLEFSEEDRETFKDMSYQQLKVVHNKLINKTINVPNVDTSTSAGYQGYETLTDAARDVARGKLDKSSYAKIKEAFTSRFN